MACFQYVLNKICIRIDYADFPSRVAVCPSGINIFSTQPGGGALPVACSAWMCDVVVGRVIINLT